MQIESVPLRDEPGMGELDDFCVLRELESLGYTGVVRCEYHQAGNTVAGLVGLKGSKRVLPGLSRERWI